MTTFSELITSTVSDLHQGGFIKDADELQHLGIWRQTKPCWQILVKTL